MLMSARRAGIRRQEQLWARKVTIAACFLMVLLVACAPFGTAQTKDISGTWVAKTQTTLGEFEIAYDLKVREGKISGTQRLPFGDAPIIDGKFDGYDFELTVELDMFGNQQKGTATGKIVGGTLVITPALPKPLPDAFRPRPMVLGPLTFRKGRPTLLLDYDSLPKIELPAVRDVRSNGLARTPPMGWNSWNRFHTNIDDRTVRAIADAMVTSGMREAGYQYIIIDDGWQGMRDRSGKLLSNRNFPDMKALADYVHSKGLKLGIYSSPGPRSCGGFEGSYGREDIDANTWAAWGIDYLKYGWCSASHIWGNRDMQAVYQRMGDALQATGRPIVYSLCQYGRSNVQEWGPRVGGNLWRTTGDISDTWQSMTHIGFSQSGLAPFAAPGHWNDPDMLEVGNGGMSDAEYTTHFSLWSMLAAPLIAGNDLRNMSPQTKEILTNKEVIAVDQDELGSAGDRLSKEGDAEVWAKPLADGSYAVALFNRGVVDIQVSVRWANLEINSKPRVRDLWAHADRECTREGFRARVPSHDAVLIRVSP
jgi:alpha-galactosidase